MEVGSGRGDLDPARRGVQHDPEPTSMDALNTSFVVVLGERLPDRQYRNGGESATL
jgi:hypothetical protein